MPRDVKLHSTAMQREATEHLAWFRGKNSVGESIVHTPATEVQVEMKPQLIRVHLQEM